MERLGRTVLDTVAKDDMSIDSFSMYSRKFQTPCLCNASQAPSMQDALNARRPHCPSMPKAMHLVQIYVIHNIVTFASLTNACQHTEHASLRADVEQCHAFESHRPGTSYLQRQTGKPRCRSCRDRIAMDHCIQLRPH